VAIDAARSIWRLGKDVTVVYRRNKCDMPANKIEIEESEAERINYRFLSAPHEILTDKTGNVTALRIDVMTCGGIDASGRRKPVSTGKFEDIACDSVILAVGERVDSEFLSEHKLETTKDGRLIINAFISRLPSLKFMPEEMPLPDLLLLPKLWVWPKKRQK